MGTATLTTKATATGNANKTDFLKQIIGITSTFWQDFFQSESFEIGCTLQLATLQQVLFLKIVFCTANDTIWLYMWLWMHCKAN